MSRRLTKLRMLNTSTILAVTRNYDRNLLINHSLINNILIIINKSIRVEFSQIVVLPCVYWTCNTSVQLIHKLIHNLCGRFHCQQVFFLNRHLIDDIVEIMIDFRHGGIFGCGNPGLAEIQRIRVAAGSLGLRPGFAAPVFCPCGGGSQIIRPELADGLLRRLPETVAG